MRGVCGALVILFSLACSATRVGWSEALQAERGGGTLPLEGVFFAVMSNPFNIRGRESIRRTWIRRIAALGAQYKFFIGNEGLVERFFEQESDVSDIVRLYGNWDNSSHQTFKTQAAAHWVLKNVERMRYMVKINEDVLPVAENFLKILPNLPERGLYGGHVVSEASPGRGKYRLQEEFWGVLDEDGHYPDYCFGGMYMLSSDAVATLAAHHNPLANPNTLFPFEEINTAMVLKNVAIYPVPLMSNHSSGTKFILSHDIYTNCSHDVVPTLCANDYVAYQPVSTWMMQNAHAAESIHQFACKVLDVDHSRFVREKNGTLEYYDIQAWYEPERVVYQPTPMIASIQAGQEPRILSEETTAVVLVMHEINEVSSINLKRWHEMSLESQFGVKILYDADHLNPSDLAGGNVELIAMTADEQRAIYPTVAYQTFSGLYGAPAKPAEISWLVSEASKEYAHAWFVECDVVISGNYTKMFRNFVRESADFMSPHMVEAAPGYPQTYWGFWGACDLASGATHSHSLISMHRVSRSFAKDIYDYLMSERGGHHEYVFPQLCTMLPSCTMKQVGPEHTAYYRFRPRVGLAYVEQNYIPDRIYHPVKPLEVIERIRIKAEEDDRKRQEAEENSMNNQEPQYV